MKYLGRIILILLFTVIFWGCYPEGQEYYSDYDIVYTNYDNHYEFSGHNNYTIPDKIVKITGSAIEGKPVEFVNSVYATPVLERIKSNMAALGYNYVADTITADLVLLPSAIEVTNISIYLD
jgi:hypothetical protein